MRVQTCMMWKIRSIQLALKRDKLERAATSAIKMELKQIISAKNLFNLYNCKKKRKCLIKNSKFFVELRI